MQPLLDSLEAGERSTCSLGHYTGDGAVQWTLFHEGDSKPSTTPQRHATVCHPHEQSRGNQIR